MKQLDFTQEYLYSDETDGISIPTHLSYRGKSIVVSAKLDTGAACCLFRDEHAKDLGVPVEEGAYTILDTLGGPLESFGHEVTIQTCGLTFQASSISPNIPICDVTCLAVRAGCENSGWLSLITTICST